MNKINSHNATNALETRRRQLLRKDLSEVLLWMDEMECINQEINALSSIEKQLIKKMSMTLNIQGLRRKNTLLMSAFCKYEQSILNEIEYGKQDYDIKRSNEHEKQREMYKELVGQFRALKKEIYLTLLKFKIK
ncbi:hypothetical protein NA63_2940 [Flavobacteriaceae bacterium MAR_2010_105]|nr:hypothetical protein NA63_2940 [Flavobacteriaceae bacterium MAR_2010_105]